MCLLRPRIFLINIKLIPRASSFVLLLFLKNLFFSINNHQYNVKLRVRAFYLYTRAFRLRAKYLCEATKTCQKKMTSLPLL